MQHETSMPDYIDHYIYQLSKVEDALNEYRTDGTLDALYRLHSDASSNAILKKWMGMAKLPDPDFALSQMDSNKLELSKLSPYSDIMLHCQKDWRRPLDLIHIIYIYAGDFDCRLKDTDLKLTCGKCYMFNVNIQKQIQPCTEDAQCLNCLISQNYLENILLKQFDRSVFFSDFLTQSFYTDSTSAPMLEFDTSDNLAVKTSFAMAIIEFTNQMPLYESMVNNHISELLIHLLRIYMENSDKQHYLKLGNNRLSDILIYIDKHCDVATLDHVAKEFHFHPSHLSRIIKQNTNMTFTDILQSTRLKHAAALLLNTELSVTDIAHQVGYNNITHFYKLFGEKYKYTPAEYRESQE